LTQDDLVLELQRDVKGQGAACSRELGGRATSQSAACRSAQQPWAHLHKQDQNIIATVTEENAEDMYNSQC